MTATQVRVARHNGTCHATGCPGPIWPGHRIVKPGPGQPWRHADCANPGRRTKVTASDDATAALARRRERSSR